MKNLYHKNNKGKVFPSPSSSSSLQNRDALTAFKLLPVAILALASVLSLEDRQVLAYLITRSMKSTNPCFEEEKKKGKKLNHTHTHKPPIFDCGCFDCYTSYWYRWDSSPNRELIHQAIEAFEEHLTKGELSNNKNNSTRRGKKRSEKMGRRVKGKMFDKEEETEEKKKKSTTVLSVVSGESPVEQMSFLVSESDGFPVVVSDKSADLLGNEEAVNYEKEEEAEVEDAVTSGELNQTVDEMVMVFPASVHKGLVRKVLPDVMGLFNSRLWNLWSPKV